MKQPVPTSYTYLRINWLSSTVERDVENQTYLSEVGEDFFFFWPLMSGYVEILVILIIRQGGVGYR